MQKIYIKDASFEVPNAPAIFQETTQPRVDLNLSQKVNNFGPNLFEVSLAVTVTCKIGEKTAYLAEVEQAGVFGAAGFDPQQLDAVLGTCCSRTCARRFPTWCRTVVSRRSCCSRSTSTRSMLKRCAAVSSRPAEQVSPPSTGSALD